MAAESITGIGPGSAEGPLRGYDLDNIRRVYINQGGNLLPCIFIQGPIQPGGGGEKYILRAVGDGQTKVDITDETPGYLLDKLIPGINIAFGVSAGPNETITINGVAGGGAAFQLVSTSVYTCPGATAAYDAVYSTGSDSVGRANATSITTGRTLGFVVSKSTPTTCIVCYSGELTGFAGLTPAAQYYLATSAGQITTTPPSSGNVVQPVGIAKNATTLVINIQLPVVS